MPAVFFIRIIEATTAGASKIVASIFQMAWILRENARAMAAHRSSVPRGVNLDTLLAPWPLPRARDWPEIVNRPQWEEELQPLLPPVTPLTVQRFLR